MFVSNHTAPTPNAGAFWTVSIVLSNGTKAGTGYAGELENAIHNALTDARAAGFVDAANGHARLAHDEYRAMTGRRMK